MGNVGPQSRTAPRPHQEGRGAKQELPDVGGTGTAETGEAALYREAPMGSSRQDLSTLM